MGRVEGAGVPSFPALRVGSLDQSPGELGGRHPDIRRHVGILGGELRPEPDLALIDSFPGPGAIAGAHADNSR